MTYDCVICLSINHASRLHCQHCGTIPTMYSVLHCPTITREHNSFSVFIPIASAIGCQRASMRRASRQNLFTVAIDKYAEA